MAQEPVHIRAEDAGQIPSVVAALGDLTDRVVFIGGAVAPLLQTHPPFEVARATKDVDAVIATTNYHGVAKLHAELRRKGFRFDTSDTTHTNRWIAPDETLFDLIPAGDHTGASGNHWDVVAIQTAVAGVLPSGRIIHYASAPGFLGLKWKAFQDRGASDPYGSHDIEDIIALIASRPKIVDEVENTVDDLARFIRVSTAEFLALDIADDVVSGAMANVLDAKIVATVRSRLRQIADGTQ